MQVTGNTQGVHSHHPSSCFGNCCQLPPGSSQLQYTHLKSSKEGFYFHFLFIINHCQHSPLLLSSCTAAKTKDQSQVRQTLANTVGVRCVVLRNVWCVSMFGVRYKYQCIMVPHTYLHSTGEHSPCCTVSVLLCGNVWSALRPKLLRFILRLQFNVSNDVYLQVLHKQCSSGVLQLYFCQQQLLV